MLPEPVFDQLRAIVGDKHVSLTQGDREGHSADQSAHPAVLPDVVVWPANTAEVSEIAKLANAHKVPIVGWGAGSSIEGNTIPLYGGIVINFTRMNQVIDVHEQDFQVTVQPGIFYKDMNQMLARFGLFFPPDPGANASIGGMIANNAAGSRTVKYGATRDNVLALEVVLANGEIVRTGSRSIKQSAGYDLTHLITGSEGTLALITEATLKLYPVPSYFSAVTAAFPTVEAASDAVFGIMGSGLTPTALELIDKATIDILNNAEGLGLPSHDHLFMEFNAATEETLNVELELVREIAEESGSITFSAGSGLEARNKLWEARHRLFEIMVRTFPGKDYNVTDVAVPISAYPELVESAAAAFSERELAGGLVGHAGDGNLHTVAFFGADDEEAHRLADEFNDILVARALELGGTCTGEHGVGIGKKKYLVHEHGEEAIAVMRQIKALFDPNNILNPGKLFT